MLQLEPLLWLLPCGLCCLAIEGCAHIKKLSAAVGFRGPRGRLALDLVGGYVESGGGLGPSLSGDNTRPATW